MRKHTGQPLPRFHLIAGKQLPDVPARLVKGLLQRPLPEEQAFHRKTKRKFLVTNRLTHQMRPVSQQYLMAVEPSDKENDNDSQSAYQHHRFFILAYNVCRVIPNNSAARLILPWQHSTTLLTCSASTCSNGTTLRPASIASFKTRISS